MSNNSSLRASIVVILGFSFLISTIIYGCQNHWLTRFLFNVETVVGRWDRSHKDELLRKSSINNVTEFMENFTLKHWYQ